MGLVVTDKKFFYENHNDSDFTANSSDYSSYLRATAGELVKAKIDFTLTNWVESTATNTFVIAQVSGTAHTCTHQNTSGGEAQGNNWSTFEEGYTFDIYDNSGGALVVTTGTVTNKINNVLYFTSSTVTTGTYTDATAKTKHEWNDFNFLYKLFGNDYKSPIDGSLQKTKAQLGATRTTLVTGDDLGSGAWQSGSWKIQFVSTPDSGYTQLFTFEHIFQVLPYYVSNGSASEATILDPINPLFKDGIINYDFKLECFIPTYEQSIFSNEFVLSGNTNWLNKSLPNKASDYSTTSIVYTDTVTSEVLTKITTENKVNCVVVITDGRATPKVTTADPITLKTSLLPPNPSANTTSLFNTVWVNENLRTTLDASTTSGTIITDFTAVRTSSSVITLDFDIEFSAAQKALILDGYDYLLSVVYEDSTMVFDESNKTQLIIDVNNYTVNPDTDSIVSETSTLYYKHFNDIGTGGTTDYDGTIEDGVVCVSTFDIEHSVYSPVLNSLAFIVEAYDTVNDTWFEIQRNDIGIDQTTFVTESSLYSAQQIEVDTTRGFDLKAANQFNLYKLETGTFSGTAQPYTLTYAFKVDWQNEISLPNADTVFYDNTLENNGLNLNTSNYSGANNYEVRFSREYKYTIGDVQTTKVIHSPNSDINDYDESDNSWTVAITTEDANAFNTELKLLDDQDTTVVATFSDTTTQTVTDTFEAVLLIKENNSNDVFEISTQRDVLSGGILKPITGTTASKSIVGGDYVVKANIDYTKLRNPNYSLSARLFKNAFYWTNFNGVDESIVLAYDSATRFQIGQTTSTGFWYKTTSTTFDIVISNKLTLANRGFNIFINNGKLGAAISSGGYMGKESTNLVNDGSWHHCFVTYTGSTTNVGWLLYIDGVLETMTDFGTSTLGAYAGTDRSDIGTYPGFGGSFLDGNLSSFGIFSTVVSPTDIATSYAQGRQYPDFASITGVEAMYILDQLNPVDEVGANNGTSSNMVAGKPPTGNFDCE